MTIDVEQGLSIAVQVVVLLGGLGAFIMWLRRWLRAQVVAPAHRTYEQVAPNGGSNESTRHLIEQTAADVAALKKLGEDNRERATRAEAKADSALTLIQQHVQTHPR